MSQTTPGHRPSFLSRRTSTCASVDYRKLHNATRKDCFPLPQIDNTLDMLTGAKWFCALDRKSGNWQVNLHPDKEKTAFSTHQGLWQFSHALRPLQCNSDI
jgi:hypothetical protein